MNGPLNLRLADSDDGPLLQAEPIDEKEAAAPKVFARAIMAPAGWPWEQTRAASLDARHGSPLPLGDVIHRLQRLDPWRFQTPARFAAFYLRKQKLEAPLSVEVELDGERLTARFEPQAYRRKEARKIAILAACLIGLVSFAAGSLIAALAKRAEVEAQLTALEAQSAAKLRHARDLQRAMLDAQAIAKARPQDASSNVTQDLAWVARSRNRASHLDAWHWQNGAMVLEVRGQAEPFVDPDRKVTRGPRPVRPGVYLWGVEPVLDTYR